MKKKGLIISAGRSDYDRYFPLLKALKNSNKFSTYLYLSSDHYDAKFGNTYKFIDKNLT